MPTRLLRICALSLCLPALPLGQPAPLQPNAVHTESGPVSGIPGRDAAITVFKGIPFAAPPLGKLRWRPPQPPPVWDHVRSAASFGPSCVQEIVREQRPLTHEFLVEGEVSEDCLYLNIWTPARRLGEKRPVLLWVHGGGFSSGSGSVAVYDGEGLARKGLVVVTFNYRLGVLGFLAHPDLSKESGYAGSGNYGLMDQIAALRWVRRNIERFGGDPDCITLAGQSSGAGSIATLAASPFAKGLFHRAILQSGGENTGDWGNLGDAEANGARFAQAKGAHSISELRALSWQDLAAPLPAAPPASGSASGGSSTRFFFLPVIDGYCLPRPVAEIVRQGVQNDVPALHGWNADDFPAPRGPTFTVAQFQERVRKFYGAMADQYLQLYAATSDDQARHMLMTMSQDEMRARMCRWAVARSATSKTDAYLYFWDHPLPGPDAAQYGAFHTAEVPYVLNTLYMSDRPFTEADRAIANVMSSYWVNFATAGDPNGKGLPHWPSARDFPRGVMNLGATPGPMPAAGTDARFDLWQKQMVSVGR